MIECPFCELYGSLRVRDIVVKHPKFWPKHQDIDELRWVPRDDVQRWLVKVAVTALRGMGADY